MHKILLIKSRQNCRFGTIWQICLIFCTIVLAAITANTKAAEKQLSKTRQQRIRKFPYANQAKKNPNICPVCGKSWNTVDGKNIHEKCFNKIMPQRFKLKCGNCGLLLIVEQRNLKFKSTDMDRDLCVHPPGRNRPLSELIICPRCGLSANSSVHQQGVDKIKRKWINENLTPHTRKSIISLLTLNLKKLKIPKEDAYKLFSVDPDAEGNKKMGISEGIVEANIPSYLRTLNGLYFADRFYPQNTMLRARYAWLTAWNFRRMVCGTVKDTIFMASMLRLTKLIGKNLPLKATPEKRINLLVAEYKLNDKHPLLDRQLMLILMGGGYLRLGFRSWAMDCFQSCIDTAMSNVAWQEATRGKKLNATEQKTIKQVREGLLRSCKIRLEAAEKEKVFLLKAADLLRQSLENKLKGKNKIMANEIPSYVYLVGEFERRVGNFPRAYAWLKAASEMRLPKAKSGAEIWSLEQMNSIKTMLGNQPVPENKNKTQDDHLLRRLARVTEQFIK